MIAKRIAAAAAVGVVSATTAVALAQQPTKPAPGSKGQASMAAIAVLHSQRDAADNATDLEQRILGAGRDVGADFSSARRVALRANGVRAKAKEALVVPATAGVCLVMDSAATCPSDESFSATGGITFLGGFRPGEPIHLNGIALDGIKSVAVELNNGETVTAPVVDNVFAVTTDAWPLRVTFADSSGTTRIVDEPLGPPRPRLP